MPSPAISILLPAHQAGPTLGAALASIGRQTFGDFECVVVDDGSSDDTAEVVRRVSATDARVRLVQTPHRGLVHALGVGLDECRAPWVARMDADDLMHRRRLELQIGALRAPDAPAVVGCHVRLFPRARLGAGRRAYEAWLNGLRDEADVARDAFVECPVAHPTLCGSAEVLRRFAYRDTGGPEDYDLILRLLRAGIRIGVVPERLLSWRDGPQRLSRTDPAYGIDRFFACKAEHLSAGFLSGAGEYILWGYGHTGRALRKALLPHGHAPAFILELHPRRLGQRIHDAPVVSPDALPGLPRLPVVASVAGAGPRGEIRARMATMGFREGRDFVCAA